MNIINRALLLLLLLAAPAFGQGQAVFVVGTAPVAGNCTSFFSTTQIKDSGINCGTLTATFTGTLNAQLIGTGTFGFASVCTPSSAGQLCYWNGTTWVLTSAPTRAGDIFYWNGAQVTTLAGNNSGTQFLQENLAGVPSWATIAGGGSVVSVVCNGVTISTSGTCPPPYAFMNCSLAASVGSNLLTVALKDSNGSDPTAGSPCNIYFRNATPSTGSWTQLTQTSALSINTNAVGATLGSSSATAFRFWVVIFNNAGTAVLGLFNATSFVNNTIATLNESLPNSSTPMSAAATSTGVIYTPNGTTVTAKSMVILGYVEYNATGLVTAGTYATAPNFVQTVGPSIKKPGDTVQSVYSPGLNGQAGISSTSFAGVTNSSFPTFSMASAANLIRFAITGLGQVTNVGGVNTTVTVQIVRNAAAFGSAIYAASASSSAGGTGWQGPMTFTGMDTPNSLAALTYSFQAKATGAGASVSFTGIAGFIEEIQG